MNKSYDSKFKNHEILEVLNREWYVIRQEREEEIFMHLILALMCLLLGEIVCGLSPY